MPHMICHLLNSNETSGMFEGTNKQNPLSLLMAWASIDVQTLGIKVQGLECLLETSSGRHIPIRGMPAGLNLPR